MALAKNKHGYDVVVDVGTGSRLVRDGELIEVPDEYFRYHVMPDSVWEVRNKPGHAALSIEEERERYEAESVADDSASADDATEREAADKAAQADLASAWDSAGESPPDEVAPVEAPADEKGDV